MDNYLVIAIMLNFKDFILFIPLNVFNGIALCFDIFIQLRANQRLATEYLLKERLDSIAFAISIVHFQVPGTRPFRTLILHARLRTSRTLPLFFIMTYVISI